MCLTAWGGLWELAAGGETSRVRSLASPGDRPGLGASVGVREQ